MSEPSVDVPDLVVTKEMATILDLHEGTLRNLRAKGGGPPFVKIGGSVRYSKSGVAAWIKAQTRTSLR